MFLFKMVDAFRQWAAQDALLAQNHGEPVASIYERAASWWDLNAQHSDLAEDELVRVLTEVMRVADRKFESVGGSTRHHVRDCLIPELEAAGLSIVRNAPVHPKRKTAD